jgi:ERCC4-type nuclease
MTLLIDDREKKPTPKEIGAALGRMGIESEVTRLGAADYQWQDSEGNLVMVTRKETDLFSSVYSDHLHKEVRQILGVLGELGGGTAWFLYTGITAPLRGGGIGVYTPAGDKWLKLRDTQRPKSPRLVEGVQASLQAAGLEVMVTPSVANGLATIYERSQQVRDGRWPTGIGRGVETPRMKWHSNTSNVARLCALWPRLQERPASVMLREFGSIANIVAAAQTDDGIKRLLQIEKIGKKGIENFKEVIG